MVLTAVQQNWRAIEFASVALRRDPEVMAAVCLECERLDGEWRQAAAEWHAARSERDADDQPHARASVALRRVSAGSMVFSFARGGGGGLGDGPVAAGGSATEVRPVSGGVVAAACGAVVHRPPRRLQPEAEAAMAVWLERSRLLRAAVAAKRAAWEAAWLECQWLESERVWEEDDRHAALGRAAAAVADQPHARASVALRRVSAGSMVFLSVPD